MLVDDLKESECKSHIELHSRLSVLLQENNYSTADLEHCLDWLAKSMVSMEKTFNRVKYERDLIQASTSNIKTAFELNLKNNQTLANEAKGLAYTIWRYEKKRKVFDKIIQKVRANKFIFFIPGGREIKAMLSEMDDKFKNYDELTRKFSKEDFDKKIEEYMKKPVILQANKIDEKEFERLMKEGQAKTKLEIQEHPSSVK